MSNEQLASHTPYFRLYKIMPFETALDCLRHWALKASLPHNSANPMENLPCFETEEERIDSFDANSEAEYALMSFTKNETSPTLWGLYGDEGRGICFQFDFPRDKNAPDNDDDGYKCYVTLPPDVHSDKEAIMQLRRMKYDDNGERFRLSNPAPEGLDKKIAIMLHKSNVWAFEKEYRFVVKMEHADLFAENKFYYRPPMPYLRRVILGPKCPFSPAYAKARFKNDSPSAGKFSYFGLENIDFKRATYDDKTFRINIPNA